MDHSIARVKGHKFLSGNDFPVEDILTVEESLKITINGKPFTVTMRTPGMEDELVRGLLFTENIYRDLTTLPLLTIRERSDAGYITWIDVQIPNGKLGDGINNSRSIMSVSSCGICGKSEFDKGPETAGIYCKETLDAKLIPELFDKMNAGQDTFRQSGGSHASAAFTMDGELLSVAEDIGRHNAADKVIGSLILKGQLNRAKCLLVSGRVSYEIVSKCYVAGIPVLASVSAPSSMAVEMSEKFGVTLLAFCRDNKFTVYSHGERIQPIVMSTQ
ncbi:MAG TPA: formate dehydrogenase accessory sulfurtransferase FdhD [Bacteroidia bacterium]|nr:formate dehydrogenase accessory sulfurtransferase FdhD [Bacteroidia bacterium]HNP97937.1 formate dehydrogenase accessory sulfurtransferase FdhD [Bacteroidia bacterium]